VPAVVEVRCHGGATALRLAKKVNAYNMWTGVSPIGIYFHTGSKPKCANDLLSFFVPEALYLYENK